jgi:hypothetical protein
MEVQQSIINLQLPALSLQHNKWLLTQRSTLLTAKVTVA